MMKYEILSTKEPEYDPQATTGDRVERTELWVSWDERPSPAAKRHFENLYPIHLYDAFHFVEGVGSV